MSYILEIECCVQNWVQAYINSIEDELSKQNRIGFVIQLFSKHIIQFLKATDQPIQCDTSLQSELHRDESKTKEDKDHARSYILDCFKWETDFEELSSNVVIHECFKKLTLNKINKPNANILSYSSISSEVDRILKAKKGFQVSSILSHSISPINSNSAASKFIDQMQYGKNENNLIEFDDLTQFVFHFYSTVVEASSIKETYSIRSLSENLKKSTMEDHDKSFTSKRTLSGSIINNETKFSTEVTQAISNLDFLPSLNVHLLPSDTLLNEWENIILGAKFKTSILNCCKNPQLLTNLNLESNNFLVFEGKPGTGKTSLAKAVFQKLSISNRSLLDNQPSIFVEFSTGDVFSKYFGESPKNLSSTLSLIEEILSSFPKLHIYLLIDELETIGTARSSIIKNNEMTDGVRIVNIFITYLDRLRKFPNLITIATTNLIDNLDPAIIDRATRTFKFDAPNIPEIKKIIKLNLEKIKTTDENLDENDLESSLQKLAAFCYVCTECIQI
ncbi:uncharacterized protein KGF55_000663 [Candida pseudojiufengensis]|uniref:uncharacterized protein n=1 Tax=Candida pseudojiufengensis TaxID=497109 RepID=UPI0022246D13|nr:uncharacterized protein KGF55_000663 [Candida pseudojiufengensis]KAI5966354.1 hypothetical protein KGF55_000663 [Candida pseudojiufengensis]